MKTVVRNASARNASELLLRYPRGVPASDWTNATVPQDHDFSEWRAPCYCETAEFRTVFSRAYKIELAARGYLYDPARPAAPTVELPSIEYPQVEWDPVMLYFRMENMTAGQVFRVVFRFL
jgi:hypothetical protein